MTNIVPGRYVFKLTVYDSQGLSASDTVSIIVHPDPLIMNLLEVTFSVGVSVLTQIEALSLQQKLLLLLGNNFKLVVRDLKMEQKTGEAILIFYVEREVSGMVIFVYARLQYRETGTLHLFRMESKTMKLYPGWKWNDF